MKQLIVCLLPVTLVACATTAPAPQQPMLSCDDCQGLTYYGPPRPAPEHPAIGVLKVLAGAGTTIAGYGYAASTVQNVTKTVADAGKYAIVTQPDPVVVNQPAPTIVTQPDPIPQPDPIIVNPPPVPDPIIVPSPDPIIIDPPPQPDPIIVPSPNPIIVPSPPPVSVGPVAP